MSQDENVRKRPRLLSDQGFQPSGGTYSPTHHDGASSLSAIGATMTASSGEKGQLDPPPPSFNIFITNMSGDLLPQQVEPQDTIASIQETIEEATGIPVGRQHLTRQGQDLDTVGTVREAGIGHDDVVHVTVKPFDKLPRMLTRRYLHSSLLLDRKVYMLGGIAAVTHRTASVECLDLQRNMWARASPLNIARQSFALVAVNGVMLAAGGYSDTNDTSSVEMCTSPGGPWTVVSPMSESRSTPVGASVQDRMYVTDSFYMSPPTMECYDPAIDYWSVTGAVHLPDDDIPSWRGAGVIDNAIYFTGTRGNDGATYRYDPRVPGLTFDKLADMPHATFEYGCTVLDTSIFVIGGGLTMSRPRLQKSVQIYDVRANRWRTGADLPRPRAGLACVADEDDGVVIAMGGLRNGRLPINPFTGHPTDRNPRNTVFRYYVTRDEWDGYDDDGEEDEDDYEGEEAHEEEEEGEGEQEEEDADEENDDDEDNWEEDEDWEGVGDWADGDEGVDNGDDDGNDGEEGQDGA